MAISLFDLFSIGIGPSSSHTMGPMRAALQFVKKLEEKELLLHVSELKVDLYGSLALTGRGHGTDSAIFLGLEGENPEEIEPSLAKNRAAQICKFQEINLLGKHSVPLIETQHLLFHKDKVLPHHPNGMRFTAFNKKA